MAEATLETLRKALGGYLRLLDRDAPPPLHALPESIETARPFLSNVGLHLPASLRASRGELSRLTYFAAAAHAAAHLRHSRILYDAEGLKAIQRVVLGALEDARVERLAAAELPGLCRLWRPFHVAGPEHGGEFRVLLARLAYGLADPGHVDPHPWVATARRLFEDEVAGRPPAEATAAVRRLASRLGNDIGQMRLQFNENTYAVEPAYRDDNAAIWIARPQPPQTLAIEEARGARPNDGGPPEQGAIEKVAEARRGEGGDGIDATAEVADAAPVLARHPEWDRLIERHRADWTTVREQPPPNGDPAVAAVELARHREPIDRLRRLLRQRTLEQMIRLRGQPEGDALDLEMAVRSAVAMRCGQPPERDVHRTTRRLRQSLAVLILLDLSASMNDAVPAAESDASVARVDARSGAGALTGDAADPRRAQGQRTFLDLTRAAALVAGSTLAAGGDACAIHGFQSSGRDDVRYTRFTDFDEPFDMAAAARVAAMRSGLSTRMGAALRHATAALWRRSEQRRLLLIVTDGAPHDIDIHDPRYLVADARMAVLEARARQVDTFCLTLDAEADRYVETVFGRGRYLVLGTAARLPETLATMVLRLRG